MPPTMPRDATRCLQLPGDEKTPEETSAPSPPPPVQAPASSLSAPRPLRAQTTLRSGPGRGYPVVHEIRRFPPVFVTVVHDVSTAAARLCSDTLLQRPRRAVRQVRQ